MISNIVL